MYTHISCVMYCLSGLYHMYQFVLVAFLCAANIASVLCTIYFQVLEAVQHPLMLRTCTVLDTRMCRES